MLYIEGIALCFDGNGYKLAAVTIRSLVMAAADRCDYDIYGITDQTVTPEHRRILGRMVADYANGYINSGVLVMNLKQMRDENIYDTWVRAAHEKDYKNPNQDLLNYTTRGRKIFLPLRYNFQSMLGKRLFQVHTEREVDDLRHGLVIIHYSNWMKPWHAPEQRPVYANLWWDAARQTGLY